MGDSRLLTEKEARDWLGGVSAKSMYNWRKAGRLRAQQSPRDGVRDRRPRGPLGRARGRRPLDQERQEVIVLMLGVHRQHAAHVAPGRAEVDYRCWVVPIERPRSRCCEEELPPLAIPDLLGIDDDAIQVENNRRNGHAGER